MPYQPPVMAQPNMMTSSAAVGVLLAFLVACVATDVRTRRIPNALSCSGLVLGLAMNTAAHGMPGLVWSFLTALGVIAVLLAPFALGGIGAGDVKMMGAVGAFLGAPVAFAALLFGMILGGVIMVAHLARIGRLREKMKVTGRMFVAALGLRSADPLRVAASDPAAVALPYSVPLALGTVMAIVIALMAGVPR
jgi:prepilin peptidase CpaA